MSYRETPAPPLLAPPSFRSARVIIALMLREMTSTYGRSPGGYVWALLQPIGAIVVLSLAFSLILRSPSLGTSFVLFYATGFLPFDLYSQLSGKTANALRYSRALLSYPAVTWIDAILARFLLNTITLLTVFCIVISGIMLLEETRTVIDARPILVGLTLAAFFALGVGMVDCVLGGLFPVWNQIWSIVTRPLFLASGVFFLYEDMPKFAQNILWWNPLLHVVGEVRRGFYPTYHASYVSLPYLGGVTLILLAAGLVFMRAHYKTVLER
ncbi:MAG: ABC transporter permease [Rhodobacterales bacterium]|nr:ABC transporter permease [Rhodobacterales bacterium]